MMKKLRKGQTMVEYIIIVCLIGVALLGVFAALSKAIGNKTAAAASKLDTEAGQEAKAAADGINENSIRDLKAD